MLTSECHVELENIVDYLLDTEIADEHAVRQHLEDECNTCLSKLQNVKLLLSNGLGVIDVHLN